MVKRKKCITGWQCGGSCISRNKNCVSRLGKEEKLLVDTFEKYVQVLIGSASSEEKFEAVEEFLNLPSEVKKTELKELEKELNSFDPLTSNLKNPKNFGFNEGFEDALQELVQNPQEHLKQLSGTKEKDREVLEKMGIKSENLISALDSFTGEDYKIMRKLNANKLLNDEEATIAQKEELFEKNKILNTFLNNAEPFQGELFRGLSSSDKTFINQIKSLTTGDILDEKSFSSYSSDLGTAKKFTNEGIILNIKPGKNTRGVSIAPYSEVPEESEVLVKKGQYEVKNINLVEGIKFIEIEEI